MSKTIIRYRLLLGDDCGDLSKGVNDWINDDPDDDENADREVKWTQWQPIVSPFYSEKEERYCQAVVQYDD